MEAPVVVARLGGVASCHELNSRGVATAAITRCVRIGTLVRLRNGWVALPAGADPDVTAAVRAGGTLSCISALAARGVWVNGTGRHIRVRRFTHLSSQGGGLTVHRAYPLSGLAPPSGGIDSVEWALAHATMCQRRRDAVASIDSALHLGLISPVRLNTVIDQLPATYAALGRICDGAAESGLETHVRLLLRSVGIRPRLQVQIGGVGRVDLLVGDRLVIETDGRVWHSDARSFAEDKRRDLELMSRGYLVVRLSYAQVIHNSDHMLDVIRGIVERGEHRWSGRHRRGGLG